MRIRAKSGLVAALFLAPWSNLAAHPLGNFSISQYSAIGIGKDDVELKYIVDMAEIPTFQEIQDTGLMPKSDDASVKAYAARKAESLRDGLTLELNGREVALKAQSHEVIFPEGAGGLPTLKIGVVFTGKLAAGTNGAYTLTYRDGNFPGRAGWKEIIATAAAGVQITNSSIPETDRSAALSNYPTDLLNSPPQVLGARVDFVPIPIAVVGESVAPSQANIGTTKSTNTGSSKATVNSIAQAAPGTPASADRRVTDSAPIKAPIRLQANQQATAKNSFTELIAAEQLDWPILLFAFVMAAALGAMHALEPGHGKTLVAAYLVGSRGTMKHALLLALIVTASHTAGVYLLGAVTLYASNYIVPERLYPWLALSSGLMIMTLGLVLFMRRYRAKEGLHHHDHGAHGHHREHDHAHDHYDHDGHGHDHGHHHRGGHSHHHHEVIRDVSLKQLLVLGVSGGIVPCPAALVVLLSAVALQRIGFGLLLIVAFSVGLAVVLISVGMLIVYARQLMAHLNSEDQWTTRWLPIASSAFIVLAGIALTWQALQSSAL